MVERKVSFSLDLSPGVAQLRQQLQSVEQLSKRSMLSIEQAKERHVQQVKRLDEQIAKFENDKTKEGERMYERSLQNKLRMTENFNLKMKQMIERARLQQQEGGGAGAAFDLGGLGHIAQMLGFNKIGQLARAGSSFGLGSQVRGGKGGFSLGGIGIGVTGAGESTALAASAGGAEVALTGLTAVLPEAALALGGLVIASKAVELGFNAVSSTAQSVLGAITQIGGARNLQEMLVEGASSERIAASIAINSTDKMSTRQVLEFMKNLSGETEFAPGEIGGMMRGFVSKTGSAREAMELGQFTTDLATVEKGRMTPEQAGALMGQLRVQFPDFTIDQTKQAARNLFGLGRAGAVELADAQDITQALGFARKIAPGNALKGLNFEMGLVQMAQRFTGGQSADQAVTGIRRLQEEILGSPGSKKFWELQNIMGPNFLTHTDTGELVFKNAPHSLAQLAIASMEGKVPSRVIEERGQKALMGITSGIGLTPGMTEAQKVKVLEDTFKKLEDAGMTIDEFDGAVKQAKDTVDYKFHQAFNKISVELEGVFLPVLEELEPVLKDLATKIVEHKTEIGDAFRSFVTGMIMVAEIIPDVVDGLKGLIKWVLSFIPNAGEKITSIKEGISNLEGGIANVSPGGKLDFLPESVKQDIITENKRVIEEQKKDLKLWESIKKMQDKDWEQSQKDAAAKADELLGRKPGASDSWDDKGSKSSAGQGDPGGHLQTIKTEAEKQTSLLKSINNKMGTTVVVAPGRSPDGVHDTVTVTHGNTSDW